jgi:3-dehydroquinate dehydratase/shikimate dehydrogenase
MEEVCRARDAATEGDLVEVRLDGVADPDPAAALAGRATPVLVTCRPSWEGGRYAGSEGDRVAMLQRAWDLGADYVDIEFAAPASEAMLRRTRGERVVLSSHDFGGTPDDLEDRFRAMRQTNAAVVKIAVRASSLADTTRVFALGTSAGKGPFIALAMGMPGLPSRVLAAKIGSCWTYAGAAWAPGQVPPGRLIEEFGFRRVAPGTQVYGVAGRPIAHSVSPAMHNAAFAAAGIDAVYVPFEAATADDLFACAAALGVRGLSVTAPFKVAVAERCRPDDLARAIGAVNTLRRTSGGWEGTNTDVAGFLEPLEARMPLSNVRAAVIGAGGAARAVAIALGSRGARVTVHARRIEAAQAVADRTGAAATLEPPRGGGWDLLVNATPVGTTPHVNETPYAGPLDGRLVYDLVYNPPATRLLRDARAAGCDTLGGLDMLVAQAARQIAWWTGSEPDQAAMRRAAERRRGSDAADDSVRPESRILVEAVEQGTARSEGGTSVPPHEA